MLTFFLRMHLWRYVTSRFPANIERSSLKTSMHLYCDVTSLCKFGALKSYLFLVLSQVPLSVKFNKRGVLHKSTWQNVFEVSSLFEFPCLILTFDLLTLKSIGAFISWGTYLWSSIIENQNILLRVKCEIDTTFKFQFDPDLQTQVNRCPDLWL